MPITITRPPVRRTRSYVPTGDIGRRLAAAQDLQRRIQELEAELSEHRAFFLEHMVSRDLHLVTLGHFQVQRKRRHSWSYSPECEREALALRARQKWEQAQGIATDSPRDYVAFTIQPNPENA